MRAVVVTLFVLLALAQSTMADSQVGAEVEIIKFKFVPQEVTVKAGQSVRWTNKEKRGYHSAWFEQAGDAEPPYLFPEETYQRAFDKPGTYPYRCGPHAEMTGTVIVQ